MKSIAQAAGVFFLGSLFLSGGFVLYNVLTFIPSPQTINIINYDSIWIASAFTLQASGVLLFGLGSVIILYSKLVG